MGLSFGNVTHHPCTTIATVTPNSVPTLCNHPLQTVRSAAIAHSIR
ncbi:MAG: hypothetical protein RBJ76_07065 [Stenomitos frigidus ULC029]